MGHFPGFGSHGTVCNFREWFGKSLYGCNLLLMIQDLFLFFHGTSDSPPMKGKLSVGVQRVCRRFSRFVYVDVHVGKCLLTSCERVIRKKTLNPFDVNTIRWDALLQHNNSKNINTTNETPNYTECCLIDNA